ncbi:Hypothetical predicted protein [Pelobates cultripes]|uniref:Uncharacterized protein n=1 Tax=Pelobates cultripes TaxID=61616 RepID=A0AAD1SJH7_PELCU|nr:Hypothetical predicted protein [Pelobates cultripes]
MASRAPSPTTSQMSYTATEASALPDSDIRDILNRLPSREDIAKMLSATITFNRVHRALRPRGGLEDFSRDIICCLNDFFLKDSIIKEARISPGSPYKVAEPYNQSPASYEIGRSDIDGAFTFALTTHTNGVTVTITTAEDGRHSSKHWSSRTSPYKIGMVRWETPRRLPNHNVEES